MIGMAIRALMVFNYQGVIMYVQYVKLNNPLMASMRGFSEKANQEVVWNVR